ncbi:MAG: HAD family hydrolase [Thermoguttaceae bacterium]
MYLEIIRPGKIGPFRAAVLDFDGTISLIRESWQKVMIPYFCEVVRETPQGKDLDPGVLHQRVRDFVDFLTGKQTIYQCIRLGEEVTALGGKAEEPLLYKAEYHRRLLEQIQHRLDRLESGQDDPRKHVVPGSFELLEMLRQHGLTLYLASGTDEVYVKQEADLLKVTPYFNGGVYGAQDDYKTFSKAMVIQRILKDHQLSGPELLGLGDGYVEIENVKEAGGTAIGVASEEEKRAGIDEWKRGRLIGAGADAIIPDYTNIAELETYLFG